MYSVTDWDGLAKIGTFEVNDREITTPALFPVVDPLQQDIPIQDFKDKFDFKQVISSAYLMSKRIGHMNFEEYPNIREYLDYDGMIMMDSGAYQVMMYGDIDLGVKDTLELQQQVQPDIGVIMDHPISYDISYHEAKTRVHNTLMNLDQSLQYLQDTQINWTLPIQGGKYLDLLETYLEQVVTPDYLDYFSFFALGSVVPVMINQDYQKLVKMIGKTRKRLPVTYPLHLFGAGHPAMFALATFLGCDSFDSAAYALMAQDGRYMTIQGTYQLENLQEFPCQCPICMKYTPNEVLDLPKDEQTRLLSEHNLYVSSAEIKNIRNAIRENTLWDLVLDRASSVPHLARGTRLAMKMINEGELSEKYNLGVPYTSKQALRIKRKKDIDKPQLERVHQASRRLFDKNTPQSLVVIAFSMEESIYKRLPDSQLKELNWAQFQLALLLPPFGIVPFGLSELWPIGQLTHELSIEDFPINSTISQLKELKQIGLGKLTLIIPSDWPENQVKPIANVIEDTTVHYTSKPMGALLDLI